MAYIDLFAGAGGLSEGFMRAGFEAVAHIEMNSDALNTIKTRLSYYYLLNNGLINKYYDYLKGNTTREELYALVPENILSTALNYTMTEENLEEIFTHIDNLLAMRANDNKVNVIVGGPPCQAYSLAGRSKQRRDAEARANGNGSTDDQRKYLYRIYCRFLAKYNPEMFVFENVPGLISADNGRHWQDIQEMLRNAGYDIDWKPLNAADFGVPQTRRRIIIIGWRRGTRHSFPNFQPVNANWTIQDILNDLPSIQAGQTKHNYKQSPSPYVAEKLRNHNDILTWHIARPHIERDREIYRFAIKTWNKNKKRLNYTEIPENLRTHKNTKDFTDRFKVVAPDLPYCHTMLAHIAKDGHYYIHPDAKQARSLTVREAARIQSFPDNYYFEGSRTSVFTQIGNAVPPLMAEAIARALHEQLN